MSTSKNIVFDDRVESPRFSAMSAKGIFLKMLFFCDCCKGCSGSIWSMVMKIIFYIGKFTGASLLRDGMRPKVGVCATPPGKWKMVASSSVVRVNGVSLHGK